MRLVSRTPLRSASTRRRVVTALLALPLVAACGGHSSNKKKIEDIFIHGDPATIYAGATNVATSVFKTADVAAYKDFNLYGGAYFQERSQVTHSTTSESGNEASNGNDVTSIDHYAFEQTADGWSFRDTAASDGGLDFKFIDQGGVLSLQTAKLDGTTDTPVEVVHYSVTPTKDAFSLLFKTTDPNDGAGIFGIWFTKNETAVVSPARDDTEYKFLLGPGILAAWPDAITIDVCGAASADDAAAMKAAATGWATDGKIGTHTLTVGQRADFAPFTDLNSHCIKLVDDFYFEDEAAYAVYAITLSSINKTTSAISGANIVISQKAFDKTPGINDDPANRRILLQYVTAHEFGHFLGLDHEFTKLADGTTPKYKSIMSYEFDAISDATPRTHDRESIAKLYAGTFKPAGGTGTGTGTGTATGTDPVATAAATANLISIATTKYNAASYVAEKSCQNDALGACVDFATIDKAISGVPTCEVGYTEAASCATAARVGGCQRQGSRQTMATLNNLELVTTWYYGPKKTAADVKADCK